MKIFIQSLEMGNFKGHQSFKTEFSEITKVSGKNGEGKSSIGDAITWNLFGTDVMGNTLDPTPLYEHEGEIYSTIMLQVEDKQIKLTRSIDKGKNTFYINDVPSKATEYKELIESLFDKKLFLSIFSPGFFPSQNWKDQREQLLKYIDEPLNKEVFENMQNIHKVALEEPLKKHSLSELDKLHKERFKKRDQAIQRVGARVSTLKEQYEKSLGSEGMDLNEVKTKLLAAQTKLEQEQNMNKNMDERENKILQLEANENFVRKQIMKKKEQLDQMKKMPVQDQCECCGQPLDYNARENMKQNHLEKLEHMKQEGKDLLLELEDIKKQREGLEAAGERVDVSDLYQEIDQYKHILFDANRIEELAGDLKYSEEEYQTIRAERNESQSILEAVKVFVDVKASLMVDKVNSLFDTLTVKLFDKQKNDSVKQTFEIEMDGKPYCKLSTAERVRAGIELIHVLQEQSGVEGPTFIDNAESILNLAVAPGQAIISTVKNHTLKVEGA